jgi:hypothetical protein
MYIKSNVYMYSGYFLSMNLQKYILVSPLVIGSVFTSLNKEQSNKT